MTPCACLPDPLIAAVAEVAAAAGESFDEELSYLVYRGLLAATRDGAPEYAGLDLMALAVALEESEGGHAD